MSDNPFTYAEAVQHWSRMLAGWARCLDASGARAYLDGEHNQADQGGSYEAVTRMLWGLGGWLALPERANTLAWHGELLDLHHLTRRALVSGTDPRSPGFWGDAPGGEYDQRTVESGQVAFATWQTRARIWNELDAHERDNLIAWLERFGRRPPVWRSNWALFWAVNHAARKALGAPFDQETIDSALDYLEGVYCGDGWYDDAMQRGAGHFDDYNLWVFATHVLAWIECDGHSQPARCDRLLERIRLLMGHVPYFFAADGAYTEYGRSLSYKFARLGALVWAYRLGAWPHSAGLLRRIVGRHMRWYLDRGALRADNTLRQSLTASGSPAVRETYISTGATYWAMLAFGALWALPADDPFWTAAEEPLPAEQGQFVRVFPQPGWVVAGDATGVQRFIGGSTGDYPAKYDKFVYSTAAPFNVGLAHGVPTPDSMLCLTDGHALGHRMGNRASAVGEAGWLRMHYEQALGSGRHRIDTTIVLRGNLHVRAHRVSLGETAVPIGAVEGSAPLGFVPGDEPRVSSDAARGWEAAAAAGRLVAIVALQGYDGQQPASAWQGRHDANSVYADYLLPRLTVERLNEQHELICLVYAGPRSAVDAAALRDEVAEYGWNADGSFMLRWADGTSVVVPALVGA